MILPTLVQIRDVPDEERPDVGLPTFLDRSCGVGHSPLGADVLGQEPPMRARALTATAFFLTRRACYKPSPTGRDEDATSSTAIRRPSEAGEDEDERMRLANFRPTLDFEAF